MRTLRWLAVPLMGVALFSAACGDDGGDDGGDAEETATSTESTGTEATETSTADSTATESSDDGNGDIASLDEIMSGFGETSFNVTYEMSGDQPDGTTGSAALTGEWKWIQDVENDRTRFEIVAEGETIIMINTPEQSLLCADGGCFDTAGAMAGMIPEIENPEESVDDLMAGSETASVREVDGREIAGTDTKCVEFEDEAEGVNGVACYAEGGIPLLIDSTTADGSFKMEALEYSTDISDADFEAPFPVTALGG